MRGSLRSLARARPLRFSQQSTWSACVLDHPLSRQICIIERSSSESVSRMRSFAHCSTCCRYTPAFTLIKEHLSSFAAATPGVSYLDPSEIFLTDDGSMIKPELIPAAPFAVHPSAEGEALMDARRAQFLRVLLDKPASALPATAAPVLPGATNATVPPTRTHTQTQSPTQGGVNTTTMNGPAASPLRRHDSRSPTQVPPADASAMLHCGNMLIAMLLGLSLAAIA